MSSYSVLNEDGLIVNMVVWDGQSEWSPGEGLTALPSQENWIIGGTFKDGDYTAPEVPPLSDEDKKSANNQFKSYMMDTSSRRISILEDAVDLEMATDEEAAALPLWKKYRVLLSRIDANTSDEVKWPEAPSF